MPKVVITEGIIDEMTLVGDGFAPRNPKAKALFVKAAEIQSPVAPAKESTMEYQVFAVDGTDYLVAADAPSFVEAVIKQTPSTAKAFIAQGYMVPSKVKNDISPGGGNGADKYETAAQHIAMAHMDLQQASGISDNDARSHAVKHVVDSHMAKMQAMKDGKDGEEADKKAGRKLSKDTVAKLEDAKGKIDALSAEIAALYAVDEAEEAPAPEAKAAEAVAEAPVEVKANVEPKAELETPAAPPMIDLEALSKAVAESVKASIAMPADNTELLTSLSTALTGLSDRLAAVEVKASEVTAKASENEALLSLAVGQARTPIGAGGLATHLENGVIVDTSGNEIVQKATEIVIPPELGAIDAANFINKQRRNGKVAVNR